MRFTRDFKPVLTFKSSKKGKFRQDQGTLLKLPPEVWSKILRMLDPLTLRRSASLVCKDWLDLIRNDSKMSGAICTSYTLCGTGCKDSWNIEEVKSFLDSFPMLKILQIPICDFEQDIFERFKEIIRKNASLEKLVLTLYEVPDKKSQIWKPVLDDEPCQKKKKASFDISKLMEFITPWKFLFHPKGNFAFNVHNIVDMEISLFDVPEDFDYDEFGEIIKKTLIGLCLFISTPRDVEKVPTMLKKLQTLKYLAIKGDCNPEHLDFSALIKACPPKVRHVHIDLDNFFGSPDVIFDVLTSFKGLRMLQLSGWVFEPGTELKIVKNNVKALHLKDCVVYAEHLKNLVNLFPHLQELTMDTCMTFEKQRYSPGDLLSHLDIIEGFENLRRLRLLNLYCQDENDTNPQKTIRRVMKRALGYVRLDLRPEIEFQITMHENHYLAIVHCTLPWEACDMVTNVSVIAEIVKTYGKEAILKKYTPGMWQVDWSSKSYRKVCNCQQSEEANDTNNNNTEETHDPNNNNTEDPNNNNPNDENNNPNEN